MRKYLINAESYQEILEAEKATKSKKVSKKLSILLTRFGGKTISETAKQMNCSESRVKRTVAEYMQSGLQEFIKPKQKENHRNLTIEEEKALLSRFEEMASAGKIVEVKPANKKSSPKWNLLQGNLAEGGEKEVQHK